MKILIAIASFILLPLTVHGALILDNTSNSNDTNPMSWGIVSESACNDCAGYGAERFNTSSSSINVDTIRMRWGKEASPTDNLIIHLQADNAGTPSGTDLASSTWTGAGSAISGIITHNFTISATLNASSTYWIIFNRSGSNDDTNYYHTFGLTTNNLGQAKRNRTGTWSDFTDSGNNKDFYFQIYGTTSGGGGTTSETQTDAKISFITMLIYGIDILFVAGSAWGTKLILT